MGDGTVLDSMALHVTSDPTIRYANIIVPAQPFYVQISGTSENGTAFQRLQTTQTTPTQIHLAFNAGGNVVLGSEKNITFTITNEGIAEQFRMTVTDTLGLVATFQPSLVF